MLLILLLHFGCLFFPATFYASFCVVEFSVFIFLNFRLFSSRRCARCGTGLSSSELVMRARDLVFHVGCFCCILCGIHLSAGDTAAVRGGRVFCSEHYDADVLR